MNLRQILQSENMSPSVNAMFDQINTLSREANAANEKRKTANLIINKMESYLLVGLEILNTAKDDPKSRADLELVAEHAFYYRRCVMFILAITRDGANAVDLDDLQESLNDVTEFYSRITERYSDAASKIDQTRLLGCTVQPYTNN